MRHFKGLFANGIHTLNHKKRLHKLYDLNLIAAIFFLYGYDFKAI